MADIVAVPEVFLRKRAPGDSEPDLTKPILSLAEYDDLYARSMSDPSKFWGEYARKNFRWNTFPEVPSLTYNFNPDKGKVFTEFLKGASTNIAYNCLDRNVEKGLGDKVALLFEPNDPSDPRREVTYAELTGKVCELAAGLRSLGVEPGDIVTIYMPMIPELPIAMLACARIGAVHSVVFGGFSGEALSNRILDAKSKVVLTCDAVFRGKKLVPLKETTDSAVVMCEGKSFRVQNVVVFKHVGEKLGVTLDMNHNRDIWWSDLIESTRRQGLSDHVQWVDAEHPLFVLYTSGSTGSPKGIAHTTAGYMVYTAVTFLHCFAYEPEDVFFCTADCGWITGHSYLAYGPMLNGATQVLYEGVPNFPSVGRLWEITDRYNVSQLYTAPTVLRGLKSAGDENVTKYSRASLKLLGTVGEPINPEVWLWYFEVVGNSRCPIVDSWWQTETGGVAMVPLPVPGLKLKPGAAMRPFFGIEAAVLDEHGKELDGECTGSLVIKRAWPSTLRTIHGDHSRMEKLYFGVFPGYYLTGDGCKRDSDGHYWLTGRIDDVLNVSGHRIGTAEVESAIVAHNDIAEAAVVGIQHELKGEAIYAFVTPMKGIEPNGELKVDVSNGVRQHIGGLAVPEVIHWAPALPKTRSGKIMRRILRQIANKGHAVSLGELGDTSTLADASVLQALLSSYGK